MSAGIKTFLFILLIPFFVAVGHDIYVNYFDEQSKIEQLKQLDINPEKFLISDLGWVFEEYTPNVINEGRTIVGKSLFQKIIDPILQLPTMIVAIIPFAIGCIYLLFAFIAGIWPFSRFDQGKNNDYAVYKHAQAKSTKYKRK